MHFYYIPSHLNYLSVLSKFLVNTYGKRIDQVQIIFAHPLQCQFFHKELIDTLKPSGCNFFLPKIIPLSSLWERFRVIKEDDKLYGRAKSIEEIICLSKNLMPNLHAADRFEVANQLHQVLKELANNNADITCLDEGLLADKSIHLQEQLKLIGEQSLNLKNSLDNNLPSYDFDNKIYSDYLKELVQLGPTIFVGLTRESKFFNQFLLDNLDNENLTFILAPICDAKNLDIFNDSKKLVEFLKVKDIKPIGQEESNFSFKDFLGVNPQSKISHISLVEAENEIEESNLIFILIKDFLDKNPGKSVALMLNNRHIINFVINNLKKYQISFADFIGENFLENKLVQFILSLTHYILESTSIDKLLACLKHPYIYCEYSNRVENIIRENVFMNSAFDISNHIEDLWLKTWWENFYSIIQKYQNKLKDEAELNDFIRISLQLSEELYPDIWKISGIEKIVNFFRDLLEANFGVIKKDEYYNFLRAILKKNRIITSRPSPQVSILSPDNSLYLNFDLVILGDMNGDIKCASNNLDMWIAGALRRSLDLTNSEEEFKAKMQDFYLLLCNKEVVLTRAKKVNNSTTSSSKFWQQLMYLAKSGKIPNSDSKNGYLDVLRYYLFDRILPVNDEFLVDSSCFPEKVSATNLELLIKNPHGFYAKNILRLYPYDELHKQELNAEFGTLLHAIICAYNKLPEIGDTKAFLQLAELEIKKLGADEFITNLWWPKIASIGSAYVDFARTRGAKRIYSEIYGQMYVDIDDKTQRIIAIADEIVVNEDGSVHIIDYKTGTPPTKKDVLSGIAPQLIVEGLILARGGFKGLPKVNPSQISFIKLSHNDPHLQEISMQDIDFDTHYSGLQNLLRYYLSQPVRYYVLPHDDYIPKYDQYRHLGRKNYFLYT